MTLPQQALRFFGPTPRRLRGAPHSVRAFTMVEIAICLAVIGFALVAIIGVLPIGMNVQKDNREETIINFDAKYLMDTIRSGSRGQDELTNYIINITNYYTYYDASTNSLSTHVNWYHVTPDSANPSTYYDIDGSKFSTRILTNGSNIVGLLTTPKYTPGVGVGRIPLGGFVSNYVTADFRAITGSVMDQGTNQASYDLAFSYRLFPEVNPFAVPDPSLTNYNDPNASLSDQVARFKYAGLVTNLQPNLNELRLRFRWPIVSPAGQLGTGTQVYRTVISGSVQPNAAGTLFFVQPQTYAAGSQIIP